MAPNKGAMTAAHKASLAAGRQESATVRAYLEELESPKKRGRKRTPESIRKRLAAIETQYESVNALQALVLAQERADLEVELKRTDGSAADLDTLEREFIKVAKSFAERRGITYGAFRAVGVPADTLKKAGISRTRQT